MKELDKTINSMIRVTDKHLYGYKSTRRVHTCNLCGKEGMLSNMRVHVEANHIEGIVNKCNYCGKTFKSRINLKLHKASHHKLTTLTPITKVV